MNNVLYLWETREGEKQWQLIDLDTYPTNFVKDMRSRSDIKLETLMAMPVSTNDLAFKYQSRDSALLKRSNFVNWDHFQYDFHANFIEVERHEDNDKYGFVSPDGHYYYSSDGDIESLTELAWSYAVDEPNGTAGLDYVINHDNFIMIYENPKEYVLETDPKTKYILRKSENFGTTIAQIETLTALGLKGCFGWSIVERTCK